MEKDPIFYQAKETQSIEKEREFTFYRCKRLFEYNFLDEREGKNALKPKILTDCLGMYDWSLSTKYKLSITMCGGTVNSSGSSRHADIVAKIKNMDVRPCHIVFVY